MRKDGWKDYVHISLILVGIGAGEFAAYGVIEIAKNAGATFVTLGDVLGLYIVCGMVGGFVGFIVGVKLYD